MVEISHKNNNNYYMRKAIDFSDRLVEMVEFIKKEDGHKTFSATLHAIVSEYYRKQYHNKYQTVTKTMDPIKEEKAKEYTKEEICEKLGGKCVMYNGIQQCEIPMGAMKKYVPLSMMGTGDYKIKE